MFFNHFFHNSTKPWHNFAKKKRNTHTNHTIYHTHNKGGYTGKLSWNLGKKWGSETCALSLPKEENNAQFATQCEAFWEHLEKAINNFTTTQYQSNADIQKYEFDSEDVALDKLGVGIMDAGQASAREKRIKKALKKKKEQEKDNGTMEGQGQPEQQQAVSVGQIGNTFILALLQGSNLLPLSQLGSIKILRSNPKAESSIVCNKKKCEITVKFCVYPPNDMNDAGDLIPATDAPNEINFGDCMSKDTIRSKEGLDYQVYLEQMAMEAMSVDNKDAKVDGNATDDNNKNKSEDEMVVTAFEVSGAIDYDKLIDKFGSKPLTPYLLRRLENVTVKRGTVPQLHRFLRREIFFSHRDIGKICELLEGWYGVSPPSENESESMATDETQSAPTPPSTPCPIYLYTGRGPSSAAMHLGHLVPFLFTAWLQKAFQCPLVIQMTDDEKFLFKGEYASENAGDGTGDEPTRTGDNLDRFANLTMENAKDIIACDFIKEKTFLFSDLQYVGRMYPNIVKIWKAVTVNQVNGVFGFDGTSNIGKIAFPAIQAAPSFGSSFPNVLGDGDAAKYSTLACLVPCAIDQDPYFRLTRDVAHKLVPRHHPMQGKPSLIHSKFFPPLQGAQGKMSSSDTNSAIFLTDTPEDIERKIKVHAFSGGRETRKLQEELGADLDVDVSYQWLRFFLEDDEELARIGREYGSGSGEFWSTGTVKAKLVEVLKGLVQDHLERRMVVTEDVVREWMTERCIA